jgi:hypothetical protein
VGKRLTGSYKQGFVKRDLTLGTRQYSKSKLQIKNRQTKISVDKPNCKEQRALAGDGLDS